MKDVLKERITSNFRVENQQSKKPERRRCIRATWRYIPENGNTQKNVFICIKR
jgi:hypothetical protein